MNILALQREMAKLPQWNEAEANTTHHFADGMYCRMLFRPAGTLIVGKKHKKAHFYIVCCGRVRITDDEDQARDIEGPCVIVSHPGVKRAVLALTDATCLTVHRTKHRHLERIERQLIEDEPEALFGSANKLLEVIK